MVFGINLLNSMMFKKFKTEHDKYKYFVRGRQRGRWEHIVNVPNSISVQSRERRIEGGLSGKNNTRAEFWKTSRRF